VLFPKRLFSFSILLLLLALSPLVASQERAEDSDSIEGISGELQQLLSSLPEGETADRSYRLGAGDQIAIRVFGEPDLTMTVTIGEAGTISYPFLGTLQVRGKTSGELEQEITTQLMNGYLVRPEVTVLISQYRKYFMDGFINRPGGYQYQPGLTVRMAVTLAGGFSPRAARDKIYIISNKSADWERGERRQDTEEISTIRRRVGLDEAVNPGDVIVIERSFF